jgi:hypothetical protein
VSSQPIQLVRKPQKPAERERLVRQARLLAWIGVGWHGIEAAVAIVAIWLSLAALAILLLTRAI